MLELAPHLAYNFFDKQCLPLFRGRVMILVRLFRVCASALLCAGALLFPENASANGAGTVVDGRAILKMSKGSNLCALTFDDGPSRHTGRLMEILRERGIHATFFVVGRQVNTTLSSSCASSRKGMKSATIPIRISRSAILPPMCSGVKS